MRPTLFIAIFTAACAAAPPEVAVVRPIEKVVTDYADFTGRTEPSASVEIRSRVTGYVDKVLFQEGALVKKGDSLFQLDDRLQRAEAAKAEAELRVAEANLKVAEANVQRLMQLLKRAAIAKEELEMATAKMEAAKAASRAAEASLEIAKLNLAYTRIASPINGRIGRCNVTAGNLVKADDATLATVVVSDPLYVSFDIDERTLLDVMRSSRDQKDAKAKVGVGFSNEKNYPHQATLDFIDHAIDAKTGTIRIRAVLENPNRELFPGLFARVRLPLGKPHKVLLIPDASVIKLVGMEGDEYFVLVVDDKGKVSQRPVKRGQLVGKLRVIERGLSTADRVCADPTISEDKTVSPREKKSNREQKIPSNVGPLSSHQLTDVLGNGPALIISAKYPGADAQTVEDTVAAPITTQINGLEGLLHQFTTCTNDGTMHLTLVLKKGTDLNAALANAQKRVELAEPTLPDLVRRLGITLRKREVHLLNLAVVSPDESRDRAFLMAYADKQIAPELRRAAGVGDVSFYGGTGPNRQLQINFDRDRLKAIGMTLAEAMDVLRKETEPTGGLGPGIIIGDRPKSADQLGEIIIKSHQGTPVRLRDVARFEMVAGWNTTTTLDGKPCVLLLVSRQVDVDAKDTAKAVQAKLEAIQKALPAGVACKVIEAEK